MAGETFKGRRVAVIGLGSTGVAVVRKLRQLGAEVFAVDEADTEKVAEAASRMRGIGADTKVGRVRASDLAGVDLVVASPGVPPDSPSMAAVRTAAVDVIGEIEFAWLLTEGTIVAVSGTNGKTTTTALIGRLMEGAGREVVVAGNIGTPFVSTIRPSDAATLYVLEVSSFHLAYAPTFRPHVAVLLNISPDHVNWHGSMDAYVEAKAALFAHQTGDDFAVINARDERISAMAPALRARVVPFSLEPLDEGLFTRDGAIASRLDGRQEKILDLDRLRIRGAHNVENALAACAAALCAGADAGEIAPRLASFEGVEHRLEKVAVVNGVSYWNDSKATNPDATAKALEAFEQPVVVLLGGRNKGNSFERLAALAEKRAKRAYVFGEARDEIGAALAKTSLPFELHPKMREAVEAAARGARRGDEIVLSPACASFDEFDNFEHRGLTFKSIVAETGGAP